METMTRRMLRDYDDRTSKNLTLNAGFGGDFLLTFVQHFRNLEIGEIDHILGCLFQILFISPGSLEKWSNFTNIFRMGWNHHLVLFIMIHPPFEASWGHVFVITLLLSSTDIITCILNTFSGKKVFAIYFDHTKSKKKHKHLKKKHPHVGGTTSPRCVLFQVAVSPHFFRRKMTSRTFHGALWLDLEDLSNSAKEGGRFKEGHDIYPVDVITKHFQVPI